MATRRFAEVYVQEIYRQSYAAEIDWKDFWSAKFMNGIDQFCKATNCSMDLKIDNDGILFGPQTCVSFLFDEPVKYLHIAACDPGGGKSVVFSKVIESVIEKYRSHCLPEDK